ncbi:MAG: mechanosensitive ion channel family protein [Polyangiales bacterium]
MLTLWLTISIVHAQEPPTPPPADVTLHEEAVFRLYRGEGTLTVTQRAQRASRALAEVVEGEDKAALAQHGIKRAVVVGAIPIIELAEADARLAGDSSLEVHAERIKQRVRSALERERERSRIANTVFSGSLVVFFGLVTVYLMRKLADYGARSRTFLVRAPHRVPALRLKRLEVMGPAALRSVLLVLLSVGQGLGLFGLGYLWLVLSLSLFVSTRPYVERLTGLVLSPLSKLVTRIAAELPVLIVVVIAIALLAVIVRTVEMFFASVARGETRPSWIEPELAAATSTLTRVGLVIFALVFVGPVLTGSPEGALSRTGVVMLLALALASTPLLASIVAGVALSFARAVKLGDRIEYGGRVGVVRDIGMIVMTLEDDDGGTVRVPHARSLFMPTRIAK